MWLDFGVLGNAGLMVLGIWWCHEMFGRWRSDGIKYRAAKDSSTRQVLIALWLLTALIVLLLINFLVGLLHNFGLL